MCTEWPNIHRGYRYLGRFHSLRIDVCTISENQCLSLTCLLLLEFLRRLIWRQMTLMQQPNLLSIRVSHEDAKLVGKSVLKDHKFSNDDCLGNCNTRYYMIHHDTAVWITKALSSKSQRKHTKLWTDVWSEPLRSCRVYEFGSAALVVQLWNQKSLTLHATDF